MLNSLRFRLVVAFVALFAAISVAVSFAGLMLRESQIRGLFDKELLTRAADLHANMARKPKITAASVAQVVNELGGQIYFHDFFVEAWRDDGLVVARSANLHGQELPMSMQLKDVTEDDVLLNEQAPKGLLPSEQRYLRGVRTRFRGADGSSYVVAIMTNPTFIVDAVNSLRLIAIGGNLAGLLAAFGAAWLVTGAMARRIEAVKGQVQRVGPENLNQRIQIREDDEIGELARHLNAMLDRLKAGFETQERFIHDASHELKTPVATVQAEAQAMLLGEPTHDELMQFVHGTNDEMRRLGRLAESLLLLTRNNESHIVRRFQPVELSEITTSALRHLSALATDHQVKLHLDYDPSVNSPVIHCDADLLESMIANLARNAIRFSPRNHEVRIRLTHDETCAVVTVEDDGPGIPGDVLPHIFDRFFQSSQAKVRRGAGVGLAIASTVAQLHGGTIRAENRPEGGARFTVRLPYSRPQAPAAAGMKQS